MTGLIDALAAVGALCLFCTAALLVILLTGDGEPEPVDPEIVRLRRRCIQLESNWRHVVRQRDELAYRDQCKQAHPSGGRTLDPRTLTDWRVN